MKPEVIIFSRKQTVSEGCSGGSRTATTFINYKNLPDVFKEYKIEYEEIIQTKIKLE